MQLVKRMAPQSVRVALYLRVSTVDQGRRGFSIPEQRKACLVKARALAPDAAALESHEFIDTAGGDLIERPELTRARAFVREFHPDYFICLDPDRFSRATYQAILIANEIEAAGTKLEFVQHDYQATSEGRLFFTLRVAIAEYEKAKILERTTRGKRGKMAAGGIPHYVCAYGYDHVSEAGRQIRRRDGVPDPGALVVNQAEAVWVRQMYEWAAQEELGSMAIADRLNQMAVPAKHGGPWRRGVVHDILRNPLYVGELRLNRYDFTGLGGQLQLPPDKRTRRLTPKQRPMEEWISVAVPPIVAAELWEKVQAVLQNMKRRSGTRLAPGRRGHLLSGLATCGLCGAPLHYAWNNRISGYLLRCANRYPRGPVACSLPHIRAEPVEVAVWQRVRCWLDDPDLPADETEPADDQADLIARLEQQVSEAKARQSRVLYLVSKGVVHPEVAESQLGEIKRHLDALEEQREAVLRRTGADVCGAPALEVGEELDHLDLQQRQTLVRMLVRQVVISGKESIELLGAGPGSIGKVQG